MIGILVLATAAAEIAITYNVPSHHIVGQPFVLDLYVFNDGETSEAIQDASYRPLVIRFTVEQNAQTYTASSTKASTGSPTMVTLQPRGLQELRFEVPIQLAWKTGTVQLQIQTPCLRFSIVRTFWYIHTP